MDRSSFHFVGSTNDLEKRQAFKAKLANKINTSFQNQESSIEDTNSFNGVPIGGRLVHPSLGEGTLVKVEYGHNEVLIDFDDKGPIPLVLSQAKSFVHSPSDVVRSSESLTKTPYLEGKLVWHPDLGSCTVLSLDENKNSISLETPLNGRVDLVFSQVKSKLRPIEIASDHVPVKPLVKEPLAKQVTQYQTRGDVVVSLPEVFKNWQRNQQFMYLTRTHHLTTEQANDVFSVLDGKKPLFYGVSVSWQSLEETQSNILPGPEAFSNKINEATVFSPLFQEKNLWHPDFGECFVASIDESKNELILQTNNGLIPFVLDITLPKLAILTSKVDHAQKQLGAKKQEKISDPHKESFKVSIILPKEFTSWKISDQYIFLTKTSLLSPECANDVIAVVSGKTSHGKIEYDISWDER